MSLLINKISKQSIQFIKINIIKTTSGDIIIIKIVNIFLKINKKIRWT